MKLAGLHLWSVELSNSPESLWITTTKRDAALAMNKADRFLKKNRERFRNSAIHAMKNHGTLDA